MTTLKEINLFKDKGFCRRCVCLKEITVMFLITLSFLIALLIVTDELY